MDELNLKGNRNNRGDAKDSENDSLSTSMNSVQASTRQKEIVDRSEIPPYFESEEGKAFLKRHPAQKRTNQTNTKEVAPKKRPVSGNQIEHSHMPDATEEANVGSEHVNSLPEGHEPTKDAVPSETVDAAQKISTRPLVDFDVIGRPRQQKLKIPNIFKSSKANAEPDERSLTIEAPVKRRLKTASMSAHSGEPEKTFPLLTKM